MMKLVRPRVSRFVPLAASCPRDGVRQRLFPPLWGLGNPHPHIDERQARLPHPLGHLSHLVGVVGSQEDEIHLRKEIWHIGGLDVHRMRDHPGSEVGVHLSEEVDFLASSNDLGQ